MRFNSFRRIAVPLLVATALIGTSSGTALASPDTSDAKIPKVEVKSDFRFDQPIFQDQKTFGSGLTPEQATDPDIKALEVRPLAGCGGRQSSAPVGGAFYLSQDGCSYIGLNSLATRYYSWQLAPFVNSNACVKARGYNHTSAVVWVSAGCGGSGGVNVPWGNVASVAKVQLASMGTTGTTVVWY
jgi:hypothetical protein